METKEYKVTRRFPCSFDQLENLELPGLRPGFEKHEEYQQ